LLSSGSQGDLSVCLILWSAVFLYTSLLLQQQHTAAITTAARRRNQQRKEHHGYQVTV
jgi:hypothetical protein